MLVFTTALTKILHVQASLQYSPEPEICDAIFPSCPVAPGCTREERDFNNIKGNAIGHAFLFESVNPTKNLSFRSEGCYDDLFNPQKSVASLGQNPPITDILTLEIPQEECLSDRVDEIACLWLKVAYTGYDVDMEGGPACNTEGLPTSKYIIFPNANNTGGGFYCRIGKNPCVQEEKIGCMRGFWGS